jgi:hypothetical protein
MKECTKCKKIKDLIEFHNQKLNKDGKQYQCKSCNYKAGKKSYELNKEDRLTKKKAYRETVLKNDFYTVYYIPSINYVGYTKQVIQLRIAQHKRRHNVDTVNYTSIKAFKTKREAIECERYYHSIGYNGAKGWRNEYINHKEGTL